MDKPIHVCENLIWTLLDDRSKLYILTLMMENNFKGECKVIAKVVGNSSVVNIMDEEGNDLDLPINILDILNN